MKKFVYPIIRFNKVAHSHEVIATSLQIWDGTEADPDDPILSKKRDDDWENW